MSRTLSCRKGARLKDYSKSFSLVLHSTYTYTQQNRPLYKWILTTVQHEEERSQTNEKEEEKKNTERNANRNGKENKATREKKGDREVNSVVTSETYLFGTGGSSPGRGGQYAFSTRMRYYTTHACPRTRSSRASFGIPCVCALLLLLPLRSIRSASLARVCVIGIYLCLSIAGKNERLSLPLESPRWEMIAPMMRKNICSYTRFGWRGKEEMRLRWWLGWLNDWSTTTTTTTTALVIFVYIYIDTRKSWTFFCCSTLRWLRVFISPSGQRQWAPNPAVVGDGFSRMRHVSRLLFPLCRLHACTRSIFLSLSLTLSLLHTVSLSIPLSRPLALASLHLLAPLLSRALPLFVLSLAVLCAVQLKLHVCEDALTRKL